MTAMGATPVEHVSSDERPLWVMGGCRRQADGTAGLPPAPEMLCAPRWLRLVPEAVIWTRHRNESAQGAAIKAIKAPVASRRTPAYDVVSPC